jgi:hypothetical protein
MTKPVRTIQYRHIAVVGDRNYFVRNYQAFIFHADAASDASDLRRWLLL